MSTTIIIFTGEDGMFNEVDEIRHNLRTELTQISKGIREITTALIADIGMLYDEMLGIPSDVSFQEVEGKKESLGLILNRLETIMDTYDYDQHTSEILPLLQEPMQSLNSLYLEAMDLAWSRLKSYFDVLNCEKWVESLDEHSRDVLREMRLHVRELSKLPKDVLLSMDGALQPDYYAFRQFLANGLPSASQRIREILDYGIKSGRIPEKARRISLDALSDLATRLSNVA